MLSRSPETLVVIACMFAYGIATAQEARKVSDKYALLIGIDEYNHSASELADGAAAAQQSGRFAPDMTYPDLKGPDKDVESMRQLLITKFNFSGDPGHMLPLLDKDAKREAILKALQTYLVDLPHKGDTAVLYVSSHGSLRVYARGEGEGELYNFLGDETDQRHAENTLVPYDWYAGVDDIFSRDLRHFFREAADKGVHVTAIFDTCHSGSLGRAALNGKLVSRNFSVDKRNMPLNPYAKEERPTLPQDDPVTPVLILSAAQKDQSAIDDQTNDPAHGVFTNALIEALNALPKNRPVSDVFSRLQVSMELAPNSIHQQPEMDTTAERRREPIFGGEAQNGSSTAAVVVANGVLLDTGNGAKTAPGQIFATVPQGAGKPTEVQILQSVASGQSLAQVQTPGGLVHVKDVLRLKNPGGGQQTATVIAINRLLLDTGIVADIGPGSIFATMPEHGDSPVEIKVTQSVGLGRSLAEIETPGGSVQAKEIVQLKAPVPWQRPDLLVYAGASNPAMAEVQDAAEAVVAAHLALVTDPSLNPWAYHIDWDAGHWNVYAHSQSLPGVVSRPQAPVNLGARLTQKSLSRIPAGSAVWFDPPLPKEAQANLFPPPKGDDPPIAAKLTNDRAQATYVIGGRMTARQGQEGAGVLSYAWFKRSDFDAEVQTPSWMGEGCSPGSSYPLRTEWIDKPTPNSLAEALNKSAVKLAKLNGWFLLQSSPLSQQSSFPYGLALRPASGGQNISHNGTTYPGDYYLELIGRPPPETQSEWVYVLNVDCQGDGTVVWPYKGDGKHASQPPAKFPTEDRNKLASVIPLPGEPFPVGDPLGTDTYLLLTTSTPLSDYTALNFDGVVSKGAVSNPLEVLLDNTSSGTRETTGPIPTDWGVWAMQVESMPKNNNPK